MQAGSQVPTPDNCRRPISHTYLNLSTEKAIKAVGADEKHGDARGEENRRRGAEENAPESGDVNYFRLLHKIEFYFIL